MTSRCDVTCPHNSNDTRWRRKPHAGEEGVQGEPHSVGLYLQSRIDGTLRHIVGHTLRHAPPFPLFPMRDGERTGEDENHGACPTPLQRPFTVEIPNLILEAWLVSSVHSTYSTCGCTCSISVLRPDSKALYCSICIKQRLWQKEPLKNPELRRPGERVLQKGIVVYRSHSTSIPLEPCDTETNPPKTASDVRTFWRLSFGHFGRRRPSCVHSSG
jgi:hypothetical protein